MCAGLGGDVAKRIDYDDGNLALGVMEEEEDTW